MEQQKLEALRILLNEPELETETVLISAIATDGVTSVSSLSGNAQSLIFAVSEVLNHLAESIAKYNDISHEDALAVILSVASDLREE